MTQPVYPSAFPVVPPQDTAAGVAVGYPYPEPGMTLRDYFAAKVLQGAVVNAQLPGLYERDPVAMEAANHLAATVYILADAMMAARNTKD